ncbi:hypothetical protein L211DRAFT_899407 [Terfezia boudieri ATCC MYA-4762]|uniref:Uncharacterized protein n=1 Tax=Terfezia boudieri ATCC MYA-4762 TaxID=1051890 RepID=A0A3N4L7X4_9PEZI|nr:hypothetical protein L211DRAFT_899407 [Terfezia boudieri ATCC MYA-4762]
MPRISKKRKACIASTAKACEARKAQRVPDDQSDIELHFDSEEEDSELQGEGGPEAADVDEEELVIEGDALAHLMAIASSIDSDSLAKEPNFKYQRGVQQSRKALYLARRFAQLLIQQKLRSSLHQKPLSTLTLSGLAYLMHLRLYQRQLYGDFTKSVNGRCRHIVMVANMVLQFKDRVYKSHRRTHVLNGD